MKLCVQKFHEQTDDAFNVRYIHDFYIRIINEAYCQKSGEVCNKNDITKYSFAILRLSGGDVDSHLFYSISALRKSSRERETPLIWDK